MRQDGKRSATSRHHPCRARCMRALRRAAELDPSRIRDFPYERLSALLDRAVQNAPRAAPWAVGALVVAQLVSFGSWWLGHTRRDPPALTRKTQPPPPPEALAAQIIAARLFGSAPVAKPGTGDEADDP